MKLNFKRKEKMEAKTHNFEREKCIGKGTFGKVYLCYDKNERQKKVT